MSSVDALARADQKIARIEEEIRRQTLALSSARAERNALLPIFRLPPEILEIIFIQLSACDYHEKISAKRPTFVVPSWVNVSYVCSYWRNAALNCPILWTYHFGLSPRWTEELLRRSSSLPLKISCIYVDPVPLKECSWWSVLVDDLLLHPERVQELHLDLSPAFFPDRLPLLAGPRLESLEIKLHYEPRVTLPITDWGTPVLRTLRLLHCPLAWHSFNLRKLSTLFLWNAPFQLGMGEFLAMLSTMQDLEILHLVDVLPSARGFSLSSSGNASAKISLPHLDLLVLAAPLSAVATFLSCVTIPSTSRLSLDLLLEHGFSTDDFAPISTFLVQQFNIPAPRSSSDRIFRSLIIDTSEVCTLNHILHLTFSASEYDCDPCSPTEESGYDIPLSIAFTIDDEGYGSNEENENEDLTVKSDECMSNLFCSLPLADVHSLHVMGPDFSSALWESVLGCLGGLQYLKLSDGWMPDLSNIFSQITTQEKPGEEVTHDQDPTSHKASHHTFIPTLEELILCRISFIPDSHAERQEDGMSPESLFGSLATRKELQDRLSMIDCDVGGEAW